jgi:DNA-binding XRE family transcriptional regulator
MVMNGLLTSLVRADNLTSPSDQRIKRKALLLTMNTDHQQKKTVAPSYQARQPITQTFGSRLREFRLQRGMTQMQLAMIAGMDRSYISDLERSSKEPSLSSLSAIAASFNMSVSDLLKGL